MDAPLNLAHRQAKKVQELAKHGPMLAEELSCHKSAAENLLLAMEMSTSVHARESLLLQHNYHVRQQDKLWQTQSMQRTVRDSLANAADSCCKPNEDAWANDAIHPLSRDGGNIRGDDAALTRSNASLYRSLADTDTLLQFLKKRTTDNISIKNFSKIHKTNAHSANARYDLNNATKQPIDDRGIIEELKIHNEALRSHVLALVNELEVAHAKNAALQQALDSYETNKTLFSDNANVPLATIDLPPLEMPKFDFEALKTELDQVQADSPG